MSLFFNPDDFCPMDSHSSPLCAKGHLPMRTRLPSPLVALLRSPIAASLAAVTATLFSTSAASAAELVLDHLAPGAIKLDGKVKEWPPSTPTNETIRSGTASADVHAGYDADGLWVAAEVKKSGAIAHSSGMGDSDDCVSLIISFPRENQVRPSPDRTTYEIGFYPGVPGSSSGGVKIRSGAMAGTVLSAAKIIEAPAKGGYSIEAFVPWSALPEARRVRAGLRGAMRVYEGNGTTTLSIKATGPGSADSPSQLPTLATEAEISLPAALATRKQSLRDIRWDVTADVTGDAFDERILVIGDAFYVLGPGFREGKQWMAFDVGQAIASLDVRDVTGDGKADLIVTTRASAGGVRREAVSVWMFNGEKPSKVFAHESAIESSGGEALHDSIAFSGGKKASITIGYQAPKIWTVGSFHEPTATDVDPILLPWGSVKERTFVFSGGSFVKDKETSQKPTAPPPGVASATTTTTSTPAPTPPPLSASEGAAASLAQYKKDRGVSGAPRWEATVDVVGKSGRAALFGRDLVVAPGGMAGFSFVTMSRYAKESDILEVIAKDVTGDGRDDFLVRGLVRAKMERPGGASQEVVREVLTIYVTSSSGGGFSIKPAGGFELMRTMGDAKVTSSYRVVAGKPPTIEIARGAATGWSEKTWPFGSESATSGVEPILLPWAAKATTRWTFRGDGFQPL